MKNRLCIFLKNPFKEQIVDSTGYQVFQWICGDWKSFGLFKRLSCSKD